MLTGSAIVAGFVTPGADFWFASLGGEMAVAILALEECLVGGAEVAEVFQLTLYAQKGKFDKFFCGGWTHRDIISFLSSVFKFLSY